MIHVATYKLQIADENGSPAELDIGGLERQIAEAFRKLGFQDVWMAEDLSLMLVERINGSDANLLNRNDVDALVSSMLTASGYADVAREYQAARGHAPFDEERREMKPWKNALDGILRKALPITETQLAKVSARCAKLLELEGMELASEKFLVSLAIHLLVNNSEGNAAERAPESKKTWQKCLSELSRQKLEQGILRPLPVSQIFPRARLAVKMSAIGDGQTDNWVSVFSVCHLLQELAPCMLEILTVWRRELAEKYPLQADSPSHVFFNDFTDYLGREPNMWRKRDRQEIRETVEGAMEELVMNKADFPIALSIK
ncbi:MAG: hypothetical protein IJS08_04225 [Victivallales bacterium]|nr:hypothetical protein [Victivallales bacterium]